MCFTEIWEKATCFFSRNPLGLGWKLPQRQPLDSLGSTSICEAAGWPTGPKCLLQCFGASLGTETFRSTHFCYLFFEVERNKHQWHVWIFVDIWYYIYIYIYVDYSYLIIYFFAKKTYHQKKATQRKKMDWSTDDSFEKRGRIFTVDASTFGGCWWGQLGFWTHGSQLGNQTKKTSTPWCHGRIGSP